MEYKLIVRLRSEHFETHGMFSRSGVFVAYLHLSKVPESLDTVYFVLGLKIVNLTIPFHILNLPDLKRAFCFFPFLFLIAGRKS